MSKTELEELGEDTSGLAQGFSKYADEIKSLTGFDIMVDDTHFKDLYDIFDGISKVWDKLNDTQKARVSEIFGGTRQLQVISSILGNWQDAVKAYGTAMNSAGTATQANATYMDSFQAKADQLKATFEKFSKDLFDTELLKGGVDFLKNTLQIVGEIVKNVGALPPLLAIIGGYLSAKNNFGFFTTINNDLNHAITGTNQLGNQMGILGRSFADIKDAWVSDRFAGVKNLFADTNDNFLTALDQEKLNAFADALRQGTNKTEALRSTMRGASGAAVDLAKATEASAEGANNLQTKVKSASIAEQAYTTTTIGARIATVAFQAAISFGLAYALQWLITSLEKVKKSIPNVENTTEWLKESSDKVEEANSKLQELNGKLATTKKRIAELLNKSKQGKLTIVEQNELDRLLRTNAEIQRTITLEKQALAAAQAKNAEEFSKNIKAQKEESWAQQQDIPDWVQNVMGFVGAGAGWSIMDTAKTAEEGDAATKFERDIDKAIDVARAKGDKWKNELKEESDFIDEYVGRLKDSLAKLGEFDYNKLSSEAQGYVDYANDSINKYSVLLGNSEDAFNNVYNQQRFDKSQKAIEQLKNEGKLTGEALKSLYDAHGNFYDMVNNMKEVGLINDTTASTFNQLAKQIQGSDEALQAMANADAAANLTKQLEDLTTQLSKVLSAYDTVKSAITEFNEKGVLSAKTLSDLINLEPEYLNLLVDENGQLNLNSASYQELVKAKMRDMIVTQMKSSLDAVMKMKVEEAQAYAAAKAYDTQTGSIYDLIGAQLKLSLAEAKKKDAANNTTAYTDAVIRTAKAYGPLISAVDNYNLSAESAEKITDRKKAALENDKKALENNKKALENQKKALEDSKKALEGQKDALEKSKKELEDYKSKLTDAQSSIKNLIDAVSDYIKQQKEDEKDAISKRKDAFDELIEKEKEELAIKKEAAEFDKTLKEKQEAVVKNSVASASLSLDDSSAGRKAQKQADDELSKSREDLQQTLSDHEYDIRVAALDKLKSESDSRFDEQIQAIEDYLNNARQIYNDACLMIQNDTGTLYANLWAYTYTYTTQTKAEFDYMWDSAHEALTRYGVAQYGVIGVMEYLQTEIYNTDAKINNLNLQIDNLDLRINKVSSSIERVAGNIDNVTNRINILSDAINNQVNTAIEKTKANIGNVSSEYTKLINNLNQQLDNVNNKANKVKENVEKTVAKVNKRTGKVLYSDGTVGDKKEVVKINYRTRMIYYSDGTSRHMDDPGGGGAFANGTTSAPGGLSLVGEKGAELRILNKGDGILTTSITKGLAALGSNPAQFIAQAGQQLMKSLFGDLSANSNSVHSLFSQSNVPVNIVNNIQGDVNPATLRELKKYQEDTVKSAFAYMQSKTLARRKPSRVR